MKRQAGCGASSKVYDTTPGAWVELRFLAVVAMAPLARSEFRDAAIRSVLMTYHGDEWARAAQVRMLRLAERVDMIWLIVDFSTGDPSAWVRIEARATIWELTRLARPRLPSAATCEVLHVDRKPARRGKRHASGA